ncbi:hypothetical protein [Maribacter aestuarii]|uniref:hypothetical protein n=1 Tax=Maribacter aestuarii TaxID=1130723 RepID=UPI00248B6FDC|nr:hypothetical protein [Maribacter aestuarii]
MNTLYSKFSTDWDDNYIGYSALSIILSTCLGAIAVMSIFTHGSGLFQMLQLLVIIVVSTAVLTSILTVQKPKLVLKSVIASVIACSILLILNSIF